MKVDRNKFKETQDVILECRSMIDSLLIKDEDKLVDSLTKISCWNYGKCDLQYWADVLDRFDDYFEDACSPYAKSKQFMNIDVWSFSKEPSFDKKLLIIKEILRFLPILVENTFGRQVFNSLEHLSKLLVCFDCSIRYTVLNLFCIFGKRSDYLTQKSSKSLINEVLSIVQIGRKKVGKTTLADLSFKKIEYDKCDEITLDFYIEKNNECNHSTFVIDSIHKYGDNPLKISINLWNNYPFLNQMKEDLIIRLKYIHIVNNPMNKDFFLKSYVLCFGILAYLNHPINFECVLNEITPLLSLDENAEIIYELKSEVLRSVSAIFRSNDDTKKTCELIVSKIPVSFIIDTLKSTLQCFNNGIHDYKSFLLNLSTSILSFLYIIAEATIGKLYINDSLVDVLLEIIKTSVDMDEITFATRSVRILDVMNNFNNTAFNRTMISVLSNRFMTEIDISIKEMEINLIQCCPVYRLALLKSVLNSLTSAVKKQSSPQHIVSDITGIVCNQLRHSLTFIFNNINFFSGLLYILAIELVMCLVHRDPSVLSQLQESGLTLLILQKICSVEVVYHREIKTIWPIYLRDFSINSHGLEEIRSVKPFEILHHFLCNNDKVQKYFGVASTTIVMTNFGECLQELVLSQESFRFDIYENINKAIRMVSNYSSDFYCSLYNHKEIKSLRNLIRKTSKLHFMDEDSFLNLLYIGEISNKNETSSFLSIVGNITPFLSRFLFENQNNLNNIVTAINEELILDWFYHSCLPIDFSVTSESKSLSTLFNCFMKDNKNTSNVDRPLLAKMFYFIEEIVSNYNYELPQCGSYLFDSIIKDYGTIPLEINPKLRILTNLHNLIKVLVLKFTYDQTVDFFRFHAQLMIENMEKFSKYLSNTFMFVIVESCTLLKICTALVENCSGVVDQNFDYKILMLETTSIYMNNDFVKLNSFHKVIGSILARELIIRVATLGRSIVEVICTTSKSIIEGSCFTDIDNSSSLSNEKDACKLMNLFVTNCLDFVENKVFTYFLQRSYDVFQINVIYPIYGIFNCLMSFLNSIIFDNQRFIIIDVLYSLIKSNQLERLLMLCLRLIDEHAVKDINTQINVDQKEFMESFLNLLYQLVFREFSANTSQSKVFEVDALVVSCSLYKIVVRVCIKLIGSKNFCSSKNLVGYLYSLSRTFSCIIKMHKNITLNKKLEKSIKTTIQPMASSTLRNSYIMESLVNSRLLDIVANRNNNRVESDVNLLNILLEMGFCENQSRQALIATNNDLNRAVDRLINGNTNSSLYIEVELPSNFNTESANLENANNSSNQDFHLINREQNNDSPTEALIVLPNPIPEEKSTVTDKETESENQDNGSSIQSQIAIGDFHDLAASVIAMCEDLMRYTSPPFDLLPTISEFILIFQEYSVKSSSLLLEKIFYMFFGGIHEIISLSNDGALNLDEFRSNKIQWLNFYAMFITHNTKKTFINVDEIINENNIISMIETVNILNKISNSAYNKEIFRLSISLFSLINFSLKRINIIKRKSEMLKKKRIWKSFNIKNASWTPFSSEHNKLIDESYINGEPYVRFDMVQKKFIIFFGLMIQFNLHNKMKKVVMFEFINDETTNDLRNLNNDTTAIVSTLENMLNVATIASNYLLAYVKSLLDVLSSSDCDILSTEIILRCLIRIWKNDEIVEAFWKDFNGIKIILSINPRNLTFSSSVSLISAILRRVLETKCFTSIYISQIIRHSLISGMGNSSFGLSNNSMGDCEINYFIGQMAPLIYCNPKIFLNCFLQNVKLSRFSKSAKYLKWNSKNFSLKINETTDLPNKHKIQKISNLLIVKIVNLIQKCITEQLSPDDTNCFSLTHLIYLIEEFCQLFPLFAEQLVEFPLSTKNSTCSSFIELIFKKLLFYNSNSKIIQLQNGYIETNVMKETQKLLAILISSYQFDTVVTSVCSEMQKFVKSLDFMNDCELKHHIVTIFCHSLGNILSFSYNTSGIFKLDLDSNYIRLDLDKFMKSVVDLQIIPRITKLIRKLNVNSPLIGETVNSCLACIKRLTNIIKYSDLKRSKIIFHHAMDKLKNNAQSSVYDQSLVNSNQNNNDTNNNGDVLTNQNESRFILSNNNQSRQWNSDEDFDNNQQNSPHDNDHEEDTNDGNNNDQEDNENNQSDNLSNSQNDSEQNVSLEIDNQQDNDDDEDENSNESNHNDLNDEENDDLGNNQSNLNNSLIDNISDIRANNFIDCQVRVYPSFQYNQNNNNFEISDPNILNDSESYNNLQNNNNNIQPIVRVNSTEDSRNQQASNNREPQIPVQFSVHFNSEANLLNPSASISTNNVENIEEQPNFMNENISSYISHRRYRGYQRRRPCIGGIHQRPNLNSSNSSNSLFLSLFEYPFFTCSNMTNAYVDNKDNQHQQSTVVSLTSRTNENHNNENSTNSNNNRTNTTNEAPNSQFYGYFDDYSFVFTASYIEFDPSNLFPYINNAYNKRLIHFLHLYFRWTELLCINEGLNYHDIIPFVRYFLNDYMNKNSHDILSVTSNIPNNVESNKTIELSHENDSNTNSSNANNEQDVTSIVQPTSALNIPSNCETIDLQPINNDILADYCELTPASNLEIQSNHEVNNAPPIENTNDSLIQPIDSEFLAALPENLRNEVISDYENYRRSLSNNPSLNRELASSLIDNRSVISNNNGSFEEINPEFLNALPEDIREELLEHQRVQREAMNVAQNQHTSSTIIPTSSHYLSTPQNNDNTNGQSLNNLPSWRPLIANNLDESFVSLIPDNLPEEMNRRNSLQNYLNFQNFCYELANGYDVPNPYSYTMNLPNLENRSAFNIGTNDRRSILMNSENNSFISYRNIRNIPDRLMDIIDTSNSLFVEDEVINRFNLAENISRSIINSFDYESLTILLSTILLEESTIKLDILQIIFKNISYNTQKLLWIIVSLLAIIKRCQSAISVEEDRTKRKKKFLFKKF